MDTRRGSAGFTLIEMIVVVALIAIISGVVLSRFDTGFAVSLSESSRFLAAELEYAAQRAVSRQRAQRWVVDLDEQLFRIEEEGDVSPPSAAPTDVDDLQLGAPLERASFAPAGNIYGNWRELPEAGVGIDQVIVAGESTMSGSGFITFAPDGSASPAEIWLLDEQGYERLLRVIAFTGEIHVLDQERGAL